MFFFKVVDNQKSFQLEVYQGESSMLSLNRHLGTFRMENLTEGPDRGLHIKFELDRSGLLHVTATEMASGNKMHHVIKRVTKSQHVSLADLESVRMKTQQEDLFAESGEEFDVDDALEWDHPEESFEQSDDLMDHQQVIDRARKIIEEGALQEQDLKELTDELALATIGNEQATKRISELLYYME